MNSLLHFLLNYIIIQLVTKNAKPYLAPIAFFSIILDFDHVIFWVRNRRKIKNKLFGEGLNQECRTMFHELFGLVLYLIIGAVFYLKSQDKILVLVSTSCLVIHIMTDFLFGYSRPFYPFSSYVFKSPLAIKNWHIRIITEALLTLIAGIVVILQISL